MLSPKKIAIFILCVYSVLTFARGPKDQKSGEAQAETYFRNQILANFRINIADDTKEVKVVRRNDDPEVFTKAYVLKHPVAYEIRPYIRSAVTDALRSSWSHTRVECLRYSDGTEAIIVSAEDYRFLKTTFGMTLDEVVKTLDLPNLASSSGQKFYCYFPRYWNAQLLCDRIKEMGILGAGDERELLDGNEKVVADEDLNAILIYANPGNIKSIAEVITRYDKPIPEVNIKYAVYQVDLENDARIGADFQAWRNGDGNNVFSLSSRMRDGWNVNGSGPASTAATRGSGTSTTMALSPRWNTRYLDFLRAQGAAKSVTSGSLTIRNNQTALIDASTSTMYIKDGAPNPKEVLSGNTSVSQKMTSSKSTVKNLYTLEMKDNSGNAVLLVHKNGSSIGDTAPVNATLSIVKSNFNNIVKYRVYVVSGDVRFSTGGQDVNALNSVKLYAGGVDAAGKPVNSEVPLTYADDLTVWHDADRKTDAYAEKFIMSFSPSVSEMATVLAFNLTSQTTAVGFGDAGEPRMNAVSYPGRVHVPNSGAEFMIGGIEKEIREKTVAKVPFLGDLPVIGWLLGSEGSASRKYQMVTVLQVSTSLPASAIDEDMSQKLARLKQASRNNGDDTYDYGFDQFYLDPDKKEFDPLP